MADRVSDLCALGASTPERGAHRLASLREYAHGQQLQLCPSGPGLRPPLLQTPAALTSSVPLEMAESKGATLETCSPGQLFESDVDRRATGPGTTITSPQAVFSEPGPAALLLGGPT